ncbi:MAG: MBOAT family O-acyltransferase [Bacteriovoracaceae bacterium]
MNLCDIDFFLFFPIVFLIYWLIPSQKIRLFWLLICSYLFYSTWKPINQLILISITIINFYGSRFFSQLEQDKKKYLFYLLILLNLSFFIIFKSWLLAHHPMGFSFYLLQGIAYLADTYRGTCPSEKNFIQYALSMSFFPQILSGPIARVQDLTAQFKIKQNLKDVDFPSAITEFSWGLFKKIYCADYLSLTIVNPVFNQTQSYHWSTLLFAVLSYTVQIYCDFSGYSSMARGIAKLLGINIILNFNYPLLSNSFVEFWTRWHISLSTWLRDYIYYPLLKAWGKIATPGIIFAATFLTWTIAGLWHGLGLTYFAYGLFQGTMVGASTYAKMYFQKKRKLKGLRKEKEKFQILNWVTTFVLFNIAMSLFRSHDLTSFAQFWKEIFTGDGTTNLVKLHAIFIIIVISVEHIIGYFKLENKIIPQNLFLKGFAVGLVLVYLFIVAPKNYVSFVYFQF